MQKEFKKSKSGVLFPLFCFLLVLLFLILNLYSLTVEFLTLNLIIEIVLAIFTFLFLIWLLNFLFTPSKLLILEENYLKINKIRKTLDIKYDDIFTIYNVPSSFLTTSNFIIYLKNGERIKIRYLKDDQVASLIILSKLDHNFFTDKENYFHKFFVRIYNFFVSFFEKFIFYKKIEELSSLKDVVNKYKENNFKKVFVLKYNHLKNEFIDDLFKDSLISYYIFEKTSPNPDENLVKKAKNEYANNNCDSILAIGGGSVIDLAKSVGILINNKKPLNKYSGLLKVKKKIPFLIAIPTTPASGSEVTWASVITFNNKKCSITSNKILPSYICIGEEFVSSLSKENLVNSVMDALTHALESYLNVYKNKKYDGYALKAIKLIYENLENAINNNDVNSKINLFKASTLAGYAFSYKGVGNVHALSHALSYKYNLNHAKTNAIILPLVLKTYLYNKSALKKLSNLAIYLSLAQKTNNKRDNALKIIEYIDNLTIKYGYNINIRVILKDDIAYLAKHAKKEAVPLYGTPVLYSKTMYSYMFLNLFSYYKKKEK